MMYKDVITTVKINTQQEKYNKHNGIKIVDNYCSNIQLSMITLHVHHINVHY